MPDSTIHTAAWLINPDKPPVAGGAVLVRSGMVEAIGPLSELKAKYSAPVVEHHDCAILPGFINAHTHLELTHFPAWRERNGMGYSPRRFVDWIIQLIKVSRGLNDSDFRSSLTEGLRKSIEAGTVAVGDIVTRYELLPLYGNTPLAGRLFLEVFGHDPIHFASRLQQALEAADSLIDSDSLLSPGISPHTMYTIGEANLAPVRTAADSRALPLAVHISESLDEGAFTYDSSGPLAEVLYPFVSWQQYLVPPRHCSSTELLDRHGLLTPATLAVHCVHLTLTDAQILKQRGSTICLCPRSNEYLNVGTAPAALFRKLGIPLALGTDSLASNDSLSLWDEMRFALDHYAGELSPSDLLHMATIGGATALGLSGQLGSLEPGKRADFQTIRHAGHEEKGLLERIIGQGRIADVCIGGHMGSESPA